MKRSEVLGYAALKADEGKAIVEKAGPEWRRYSVLVIHLKNEPRYEEKDA